jgi:hypothetical protein
MARAVTGVTVTKPARVDEQGKFAFDDLPTAAYILIATAPGYIDQSITLADQSQWPRYLIGAQLKITMIKGGVITGTVTSPKGDPVVGVTVIASPTTELSAFASNLLGLQNQGETDDRGIYADVGPETDRVTTLGRLAPGSVVNLERPLGAVDAAGDRVDLVGDRRVERVDRLERAR